MNSTDKPLVSVICLCYNHAEYVVDSIASVLAQTYPNIELIIVDDASTDESQKVIANYIIEHPQIKYIPLNRNIGNCTAFNKGWGASSGDYIIDLAADDILLPDRIMTGIECFKNNGKEYGVHFGDARIIDKYSKETGKHLTTSFFQEKVPEGFLFRLILEKYFINPATMMYSKPLLKYLGGYDESLAYEDFDLWVRSTKKFKYCYSEQLLVAKRNLPGSQSNKQYNPGSKMLWSTLKICHKAFSLCENREDLEALLLRVGYEMKMAFVSLNWTVAWNFYKLRRHIKENISVPGS